VLGELKASRGRRVATVLIKWLRQAQQLGISFDVEHFGSVCHWLAFPMAASYWEKQGQWNEAFVFEFRTIS
jgi:hypothetical protein